MSTQEPKDSKKSDRGPRSEKLFTARPATLTLNQMARFAVEQRWRVEPATFNVKPFTSKK